MTSEPAPPTADAPERPDVEALMARVRAAVADKLARGVYTAADVERVRRMELSIRERRDHGPDFEEGVARLHATWDPLRQVPLSSHRAGVGALIVAAKKVLRKALRPLGGVLLQPQAEFNAQVARLLTAAIQRHQNLQLRYEELILKYYETVRRLDEMARQHRDLILEVQRERARREAEERALLPPEALAAAPPASPPPGGPAPVSYLAFEEKHRGPSHELMERQRGYLRHFAGAAAPVLDAGCGRGEFLALCREAGIPAYGIDADAEMVAVARRAGLDVRHGDALAHLEGLPDGSLGGLFAAQVVEHLTTAQLYRLAQLLRDKLAPGARALLETVNPTCLSTFSGAFYLDLSHVRPIHPEALRFLLEGVGMRDVQVEYTSPVPAAMQLKEVSLLGRLEVVEQELLDAVNRNFAQINHLLYGCQDYAVVATR